MWSAFKELIKSESDWETYGMAEISPHLEDRQKLMTVLSLCTFLLASLTYIYILLPFPVGCLCFEKLERLFVE